MSKFFLKKALLILIFSFFIFNTVAFSSVHRTKISLLEFSPATFVHFGTSKESCSGGSPEEPCKYDTIYQKDIYLGLMMRVFIFETDIIEFDIFGLSYFNGLSDLDNRALWIRLLGFYYKHKDFKFGLSIFPFMGDMVMIGKNFLTMSTLKLELIYRIKKDFNLFFQIASTGRNILFPNDCICDRNFYFFDGFSTILGVKYDFKFF